MKFTYSCNICFGVFHRKADMPILCPQCNSNNALEITLIEFYQYTIDELREENRQLRDKLRRFENEMDSTTLSKS